VTPAFFTIGHSNRTLEEFTALLREARIERVADIRKTPKSRTNPQFNQDALPRGLAASGIAYEHIAALGGRRSKTKDIPSDLNGFWANASFHNYADYALSDEFSAGLAQLRDDGHRLCTAVMCSEAVWWRCHRRIVTDYLIAFGENVSHIMGHGRPEAARLTPGAVIRPDGTIVYPATSAENCGARD